jgi:hypothetical protein
MRPFFRPTNGTQTGLAPMNKNHSKMTTKQTNLVCQGIMKGACNFNKMPKPCLTNWIGIPKSPKNNKPLQVSYKNPHMLKRQRHRTQYPKRGKTKCYPNQFNWTKVNQCLINLYLIYQCLNLRLRFKSQTFPLHSCHMKIPRLGHPLHLNLQS